MKRRIVIIISIFIMLGCHISPKAELSQQHNDSIHSQSPQSDCDSLYKKAFTLMTHYVINGRDPQKLVKAELLLDSINLGNCPNYKAKVFNMKIYILTNEKKYEDAINYVQKIPQDHFIKPYTKELYINSMLAYCYKLKNDKKWVIYYKQAISPVILYLLKSPTDVQALIDLYYHKAIFKGKKAILKELNEKISTDSLNSDTFEAMKETFETINYQLIYP